MDRPPQPLTSAQHIRLIQLVDRRAPALLNVARDAVNHRWLSDDEAEALLKVALDEFLAHLGPDDEPDREGAEADDLASRRDRDAASRLLGVLASGRRAVASDEQG